MKRHDTIELESNPSLWPHASGAPDAGGATTRGSLFGGRGLWPSLLRAVARLARAVEAEAYRRLRDLDRDVSDVGETRGRPHRVKEAATPPASA
jgi:hypothetical protein